MNTPISAGDTAWLLASTALVFLMVPGLALFYGGLVRARAALNTFMMSFAAVAVVSVLWVLCGYSLAFAPGGPIIGGLQWAGLWGVSIAAPGPYASTVPHISFAIFQALFAGIAAALISGAMVERVRFHVYMIFVVAWTMLVYVPIAHWVWGEGGWLRELGALDFAGGTVVHISAGTAALIAALMLGRRRGLGVTPLVPHNVPFTLVGAGLLWVGWFGFNAGSALSAGPVAALALITTHTAAASALLAWITLDLVRTGQATAVGAATGAVVGLVAITPAAGYVTPMAAIAIGALGAGASYAAMQLRARSKVDDALDVFACHGIGGIVGALLTGVFATRAVNPAGADGLLAGNPRLLGVQAVAVGATIVFTAAFTALILWRLSALGSLRVPAWDELAGIDQSEHGEHAYQADDGSGVAGGGSGLGGGVLVPVMAEAAREQHAA